jgi:hypothetical protein
MYYPGMLPVAGSDDLTLNVRQFQTLWEETLRIIDGLRETPEMPSTLRMSIDSLRFHAGTVLAAINEFLRVGGAYHDDAYEVPSVEAAIPLFQQELLRTEAHWDAWTGGGVASFGATQLDTRSEQAVIDGMRPQTNMESLIFLAGGALVIGALILVKK